MVICEKTSTTILSSDHLCGWNLSNDVKEGYKAPIVPLENILLASHGLNYMPGKDDYTTPLIGDGDLLTLELL